MLLLSRPGSPPGGIRALCVGQGQCWDGGIHGSVGSGLFQLEDVRDWHEWEQLCLPVFSEILSGRPDSGTVTFPALRAQ